MKIDKKMKDVVKEYVEITTKDCYKLVKVSDETPTILDDKLGGTPYIPKGAQIPLDSDGNPMALLLQLNMKSIQLEGYPNKGILEIFNSPMDTPQEFKIMIFDEGLEPETDLPEVDTSFHYIVNPVKIRAEKSKCSMPVQDYRCVSVLNQILSKHGQETISSTWDLSDDVVDLLWDSTLSDAITIGGYADFTQCDPRDEGDNRTECFLKLDSAFGSDVDVGDSGIAFILCSKEDIEKRQFDKMYMDFDCC